MTAVAATKRTPPKPPARPDPVAIMVRVTEPQAEELDAWIEQLNEARGYPKLTRTDVFRNLLAWALKEHPDWMGR